MVSLYLQKIGLPKIPYRHWNDTTNHHKFASLRYQSPKDWLQITKQDIKDFGGDGILQIYDSSPSKFVKSVVGGCAGLADWMFVSKPQRTWHSHDNARCWFEYVMLQEDWKHTDELYGISQEDFKTYNGIGLLGKCGYSIIKTLQFAYPKKTWDPLKFKRIPNGYWSTDEAVTMWVKTLMHEKGWTCPNDLYQIRATHFRFRTHGWSVYIRCGNSIMNVLRRVFPDFPWDLRKFNIFQSSDGAIEWIEFRQVSEGPIAHARNGGEIRVPDTKMALDGTLLSNQKRGFQYHGSFWHGDPRRFDADEINPRTLCTFGELYEKTKTQTERLRGLGYVIEEMMEWDWDKGKRSLVQLQRAWRSRKSQ